MHECQLQQIFTLLHCFTIPAQANCNPTAVLRQPLWVSAPPDAPSRWYARGVSIDRTRAAACVRRPWQAFGQLTPGESLTFTGLDAALQEMADSSDSWNNLMFRHAVVNWSAPPRKVSSPPRPSGG